MAKLVDLSSMSLVVHVSLFTSLTLICLCPMLTVSGLVSSHSQSSWSGLRLTYERMLGANLGGSGEPSQVMCSTRGSEVSVSGLAEAALRKLPRVMLGCDLEYFENLKLTWCGLCVKPQSVLGVHHLRRQGQADQISSLFLCLSSGSSFFFHIQRNYYPGSYHCVLEMNWQENHSEEWWQIDESKAEISFSVHDDVLLYLTKASSSMTSPRLIPCYFSSLSPPQVVASPETLYVLDTGWCTEGCRENPWMAGFDIKIAHNMALYLYLLNCRNL